jgi:hypothetical protein
MIEAPERIWGHIDGDKGSWGRNWVFDDDVEYIRADLVEELEDKLTGAAAECERIGRLWYDAEAKLSKAIDALLAWKHYDEHVEDDHVSLMLNYADAIEKTRTTLAELHWEDRG